MRKKNKEIQLTSYEDLLGMDSVADQAAGQRREGVGQAPADRDGGFRIDGGSADHIQTVARGADRQAAGRANHADDHETHNGRDQRAQAQPAPPPADKAP